MSGSEGIGRATTRSGGAWVVVWVLTFGGLLGATALSATPNASIVVGRLSQVLSVLGSSAAILVVLGTPSARRRLITVPGIRVVAVVALYGLVWGYVTSADMVQWSADCTVFRSLLTGVCMAMLCPRRESLLATLLFAVLAASVSLSWFLTKVGDVGAVLSAGIRETDPNAFLLSYLVIVLLGPVMGISAVAKRRIQFVLSVGVGIVYLFLGVGIMQTRSLFIAVSVAMVLGLISAAAISWSNRTRHRITPVVVARTFIVVALVVTASAFGVVPTRLPTPTGFTVFQTRLMNVGHDAQSNDRIAEATDALESLPVTGHIAGMGFGGGGTVVGRMYGTNLHIAILNVWTRFGLPCFVFVALLSLILVRDYIRAIARLCLLRNRAPALVLRDQWTATLAPGALSSVCIACISGGWTPYGFVGLGLLWGLWHVMRSPWRPGSAAVHSIEAACDLTRTI